MADLAGVIRAAVWRYGWEPLKLGGPSLGPPESAIAALEDYRLCRADRHAERSGTGFQRVRVRVHAQREEDPLAARRAYELLCRRHLSVMGDQDTLHGALYKQGAVIFGGDRAEYPDTITRNGGVRSTGIAAHGIMGAPEGADHREQARLSIRAPKG